MEFEWDLEKAASNLKKHGISFEEAVTAFDDENHFVKNDEKHSTPSEVRELLIGRSVNGRVVLIVHTIRGGSVYRIISARLASRKERELYETLGNT